MDIKKVKTVVSELDKFCYTTDGKGYINITEWINEEGWDISIERGVGSGINISLHIDELEAINYLTKVLRYETED